MMLTADGCADFMGLQLKTCSIAAQLPLYRFGRWHGGRHRWSPQQRQMCRPTRPFLDHALAPEAATPGTPASVAA